MKIYVDESNISRNKGDKKFVIAAFGVFENEKMKKNAQYIISKYSKDGKEVKGTDLSTRASTDIRAAVVDLILPYAGGVFFIYEWNLQKCLDATWEFKEQIMCEYEKNIFLKNRHLLVNWMSKVSYDNWFSVESPTSWLEDTLKKLMQQKDNMTPSVYSIIMGQIMIVRKWVKHPKWTNKIIMNNYQVLNNLLSVVAERCSGNYEMNFDDFDNDYKKEIAHENKNLNLTFNKSNEIKFLESQSSIYIQIADWVTSLYRKSINTLLVEWLRHEHSETIITDESIKFGEELLTILKTLDTSKWIGSEQLNYHEKSFLRILKTCKSIKAVFDKRFWKLVSKQESIIAQEEFEETSRMMDIFRDVI